MSFLAASTHIHIMRTQVVVNDLTVDSVAYELVRHPERFDVLLAPNLYGDILQDLCTAFAGSIDLVRAKTGTSHGICCIAYANTSLANYFFVLWISLPLIYVHVGSMQAPTANVGDKFILTHASNIVTPPQPRYPKQSNPLYVCAALSISLTLLSVFLLSFCLFAAPSLVHSI